jgi:hypothetical protein
MPKSTVLLRMLYDAIDLCLGLSRLSSSSAKVKSDAVEDLCLVTIRQHISLAVVYPVYTHTILFSSGAGEDVAL